jgi:hypothetical protein
MNTKKVVALIGASVLGACNVNAAETIQLFNGKDLAGWKVAEFQDAGKVEVLPDGVISCQAGKPLSGIAYTNPVPTMSYELKLEAMRAEGSDFFIALTLPIEDSFCTVIIGGWGGMVCGISCINYMSAVDNQYVRGLTLENNQWYTLRVRVMPNVMQVFLDDKLYHARVEYEKASIFSLRSGSDLEKTKPLSLASYDTHAKWRNFTLTKITEPTEDDKPKNEEW